VSFARTGEAGPEPQGKEDAGPGERGKCASAALEVGLNNQLLGLGMDRRRPIG
jgi:hypothetical protein